MKFYKVRSRLFDHLCNQAFHGCNRADIPGGHSYMRAVQNGALAVGFTLTANFNDREIKLIGFSSKNAFDRVIAVSEDFILEEMTPRFESYGQNKEPIEAMYEEITEEQFESVKNKALAILIQV